MAQQERVAFSERIVRSLRVATIVLKESLRSFLANNDFEMSAALATYSFFALVPLLFFVVNAVSRAGGAAATIVSGVVALIDHLFPRISGWMSIEFSVVTGHHLTLGFATAVVVFIASMSLVDTLRTTFFKIFRKDPPASFVTTQLANIRSAAIMLLFFTVLVVAEVTAFRIDPLSAVKASHAGGLGALLVSVLIASLCMAFFYRVFLPVRLTLWKLAAASVTSAVLIITMREIFAYVLETNPEYGQTFGSLKVLFVMIVWVYYCFLVILFGAEVAVNVEKRDALLLKNLFEGSMQGPVVRGLFNRFVVCRNAGDVVFDKGDSGGVMFYVIQGSVDIDRDGRHIRTMVSGDYFGEMSMLLGTPRSAGARAAADNTELIAISQENFDIILRENSPIVLSLLKEMADRLKDTDESLFGN